MTDDELLAELTRVRAVADPPPDHVVEAARAALSTRRWDEELAELVADSAVDDGLALVRDGDAPRLVSFALGAVSVDLQIERDSDGLTVRGLVTGTGDQVAVEDRDRAHPATLNAGGWFTVTGVRPGPVRVRWRASSGAAVRTAWIAA